MSEDKTGNYWAFESLPATGSRPKIRFNDYAPPRPASSPSTRYFYSNEPIIELTLTQRAERVEPLNPEPTWAAGSDPVFVDPLKYAAYIGSVQVLSATELEDDAVLPDTAVFPIMPPQPSFKTARGRELREVSGTAQNACLFNILVALEWQSPSPEYLQQLQWAFRRASDFLYDVTNGYMAFGQVIFAGPEYMRAADIQIFASSRLFPRSWVSGMYNKHKHAPIRVGRGLWSKNRKAIIPWDEPEAFRILVHEWAHYALGLKDGYLEQHTAVLSAQSMQAERLVEQELTSDGPTRSRGAVETSGQNQTKLYQLAIPSIALPVESIMSVLEGTSELVPHPVAVPHGQKNKQSEWDELIMRFPQLEIRAQDIIDEGPGRFPLPLPQFGMIPPMPDDGNTIASRRATITRPKTKSSGRHVGENPNQPVTSPETGYTVSEQPAWVNPFWLPIYDKQAADQSQQVYPSIESEHCWVYVLKGTLDAPQGLVAQGSLPERAKGEGYDLLGAEDGDIVILIGNGYPRAPGDNASNAAAAPIVLWARLGAELAWNTATPKPFPLVDVCPEPTSTTQRPYKITVRIEPASPYWQTYVFPFDEAQAIKVELERESSATPELSRLISRPIRNLNALDGHVLLIAGSSDDPQNLQITIATYSIGGSPSSAYPPLPNPISAGSSEGNIMVFFYDQRLAEGKEAEFDQSDKVVVTTLNHGIQVPNTFGPRSYTFSLAANRALPDNLSPTLVMFYDKATARASDELFICRYHEKTQADPAQWKKVPTYLVAASSFTAAPLGTENAPSLFAKDTLARVERFRLCLVPPNGSASEAQS